MSNRICGPAFEDWGRELSSSWSPREWGWRRTACAAIRRLRTAEAIAETLRACAPGLEYNDHMSSSDYFYVLLAVPRRQGAPFISVMIEWGERWWLRGRKPTIVVDSPMADEGEENIVLVEAKRLHDSGVLEAVLGLWTAVGVRK